MVHVPPGKDTPVMCMHGPEFMNGPDQVPALLQPTAQTHGNRDCKMHERALDNARHSVA